MYLDCMMNEQPTMATMRLIPSFDHKLYSVVSTKVALSPFDDKRYVLDDKVSTRAHGHFRNSIVVPPGDHN